MAPSNYKTEKMDRREVRKLIRKIVSENPQSVYFSSHCRKELENDGLTTVDAWNVLKSADSNIYDEGEFERGSYRYRLETTNLMVVVAFQEDGQSLTLVTAWDKRIKN